MCGLETTAGLRIDVDTLRGTRLGVPGLLHVLNKHQIKATFFFSVGPDNMGRHLRRLLRPAFLVKMLRSKATSLYGWDILLRGTMWPGPVIGDECADSIRRTAEAGHEIGLHAWDHHRWQMKIAGMGREMVRLQLEKGKDKLGEITKQPVTCSAVPGWRCTDVVLEEKEHLGFRYNSDCRGHSLFYPQVKGVQLSQPQVPVTLPTYDELIGSNGIDRQNYNDHLLTLFSPERLNVLTIHAEAEGISCLQMFQEFLKKARSRNIIFKPLGELLQGDPVIESCPMVQKTMEGREGWISRQEETSRESHGKS